MSEPRVRRIEARPVTQEVEEYRTLLRLAQQPVVGDPDEAARELVRLCRYRARAAILRSNLRFGRSLQLIRVADLDGDGQNEMLVVDADHTVHTPRLLRSSSETGSGAQWLIGAHRYRGRLLGVSFSSFGVFHRQEAIVTSVEEFPEGALYRELKLNWDGQSWDVAELEHRHGPTDGNVGQIRLIGDSSEPGRVPVLRASSGDGRLWVEVLDDRRAPSSAPGELFSSVSFLPGEVTDLLLTENELVVAYARGGIQRIGPDGRLREVLFPQWRFVCLAYAPSRLLGEKSPSPGHGLLLGGTSFGYVFAMDPAQAGVLWRMDAGFLFSSMALADAENSGRIDLILGGIDGSMRVYELSDLALIDQRCQRLYHVLGPSAQDRLLRLAPPGHEAHPAVQLYQLSRILDSIGPASQAVVELVRWFTPGQPGWHMLPERSQREAVVTLEHYLLLHLPQLARDEQRATRTGPLPLISLKQLREASNGLRTSPMDPSTKLQVARTALAELVDIYLGAPRLVRHQIDRISRRLLEQYLVDTHPSETELEPRRGADSPPPELKRLLNVRSLRAREYAHTLLVEAEQRVTQLEALGEPLPSITEDHDAVMTRVLRAIGLIEELRVDRFSVELERLDLRATAADPLILSLIEQPGEALAPPRSWPQQTYVVGIGRRGTLRIEPLDSTQPLLSGEPPPATGTPLPGPTDSGEWPWRGHSGGLEAELPAGSSPRFVEVRQLLGKSGKLESAIIVGLEEKHDSRLRMYTLSPSGEPQLAGELRCGGAGAEPVGYDLHLDGVEPGPGPRAEVLLLRVPALSESGRALIVAVDLHDGVPRLRPHLLPPELLCVTSNTHASLRVTGSRVSIVREDGALLSVPAPVGVTVSALDDSGTLAAVGTTSGQVQMFVAQEDALRLVGQHLFSKGISALCFVPSGVFGVPCIAIGTEDEQVHILAVDHQHDGQELARLAVGGTPLRLLCRPIESGGYRMLILLQGGVLGCWEAHPQDGHLSAIEHLFEIGARASGSRANVLRAALRGQGPHIRAVALRELLRSAREGGIAGSIFTVGNSDSGRGSASSKPPVRRETPPAGTRTGSPSSRSLPERGTPAVASVLHLSRLLLQSDPTGTGGETPSRTSGRSDVYDISTWPLPRPPRHRILVTQLLEALVPIALGGTGSGADLMQSKLGRELIARLVQYCEEPLGVRGDLLQIIERHVRPEHIEELLGWLPQLILSDSRGAAWPFAMDSVAALFLRHLVRLDRAKMFDQVEPIFFRNVVAVLEAVSPSQPSRFLLTNLALLVRSALSWDRAYLAGDLARTRLYLPNSVIEAMCQPEILTDAEARTFLLGVSRRWGPRLPTIGTEDNEEAQGGADGEVYWWFEVAVENGFDQLYYERLADELSRCALPVTPDGQNPDSWALAEIVQGLQRLFDVTNLADLQASLQAQVVDKALAPLRAQRALSAKHVSYRYRDEAWAFFDEEAYLKEQVLLSQALLELDRKTNKAQIAHSLDELAGQLEQRRNSLRLRLLDQLTNAPPLGHAGAFVSRMLAVRPMATVVALLTVWWQVLLEEANRLRTEPDFEVRLVSDLGVSEGRRMLRYAIMLASDAARTAHGVVVNVRATDPKEVRARPVDSEPVDLDPGHELGLFIDCPAGIAADGLRYRVEIELSHDGDKRTERVIEGQFRRESRQMARSLFDSFGERLPTLFQARKEQLIEAVKPAQSAVALVTAFAAHAYELLAETLGLDWPERPVDTLEQWRMVNVAARTATPGSGGTTQGRTATPTLREVLQQIAQRLGGLLGLPGAERLDTVEALIRAVSEAPVPMGRGLLLLGLPELAERTRLDEQDQRQLLSLGARIALAYRGRALVLLSPQAAALSLGLPPLSAPASQPPAAQLADSAPRTLEILDIDHVADPYSVQRNDERMRAELEQALAGLLQAREGQASAANTTVVAQAFSGTAAQLPALRALIDATGSDLRLIAECLPVVEQALRERTRAPISPGALEARVGTCLLPVWSALPLAHRLYLAALSGDATDLDVGELRPGMVVDAPVHSISGKDRLPTSKVVAAAGVRLDQRTIDDLERVMWLKKVRIRGSTQDSRTVLWTYLRQPRPRGRIHDGDPGGRERWLEPTSLDLRRLGLIRTLRLSGERPFVAFVSTAVREWLRAMLGIADGEVGLPSTIDGRNLVRQLPLWDAAAVDRALGGNSALLRAVLGWNRPGVQALPSRWNEFLDLSRACRKWVDGQDEHRFVEALARYYRLDLVEGTAVDEVGSSAIGMRSVQVRFREKRQLPWLKRVVLYLPAGQPDRPALEQVQVDLRARMPVISSGSSGPQLLPRPDAAYAGIDGTISDTSLSAIVVVPELTPEVTSWSRNLFHVAAIDIADLQHAALHDHPVEELIRRLAAAASYAALSPFRSKMGLANQELIEEMFYGRRSLLEEIRGQRQENFLIVGPRKIGKTSLLQRVRFELERQGYRVIPRGMDYTTAPTSRDLLRAMITELFEDFDATRAAAGFALGEPLPPLRSVIDEWTRHHPDRSIAIVLDEIDTVLRIERRAYLLGEWREAWTLGQALASLRPAGAGMPTRELLEPVRVALLQTGLPPDVAEGVVEGLLTKPEDRRQSPLLEELRSAAALLLHGGAVCRVILAGHAEMVEARWDLFGPLLNFAKLRMLGPIDDNSAERMVREPFARLGLRFESATAEQLLLEKTFRVPAWIQHCGALIIQSIDERLRSSRREEQKITERDVILALEKVHAEERAALQSENGMYMLGPECSFVLLSLVDEPWFTLDTAVEYLHVFFSTLDEKDRRRIAQRDDDFFTAFSPEPVRRIVRDLTNTFYLISDEAEYLTTEGRLSNSAPVLPSVDVDGVDPSGIGRLGALGRHDRLRKSYKVARTMVSTVFHEELALGRRIELARRAIRLWQEGRGVWARTSTRAGG